MNLTKVSETFTIIITSIILVSLVYAFTTFHAIGFIIAGFTAIAWYIIQIASKLFISTENKK